MHLSKYDQNWIQICKKQTILPFPLLIFNSLATLAYKTIHGLNENAQWDKLEIGAVHSHLTRHVKKLRLLPERLECYKQSTNYSLAKTWNGITEYVSNFLFRIRCLNSN